MIGRLLCSCVLGIALLRAGRPTPVQEPENLVVKSEISVGDERGTDFVLPIVTDAGGYIYIRYSNDHRPADVVRKISPSGRNVASFSLVHVPGLAGATIGGFCVSEDRFLVLARQGKASGESMHLVAFTSEGKFLSANKIDSDVQAGQIVPLAADRFIVAGRVHGATGSGDSIPRLVVINSMGHLVDDINLEGDVAPIEKERRTTVRGDVRRDPEFEMSLVASTITTGDDGNAYVMRYGNSGLVFVISPGGTVIHRFALELPSGSSLKEIKVAKDRIAALFVRWKSDAPSEVAATFVRIYHGDTGKMLSSYRVDPSIPDLMAAFDGRTGFTFIGPKVVDTNAAEAGRLRIFEVGPE